MSHTLFDLYTRRCKIIRIITLITIIIFIIIIIRLLRQKAAQRIE